MLIDLTQTITPEMPGVELTPARTLEDDGWNAQTLHLYSHSGTHMDAPWHFGCGEKFIDETPLESCIGPAFCLHLPETKPSELLTISHLGTLEESFPAGHSLLLHSGWSQYHGNLEIFRNQLPRISPELAHWCVARKVKLLGVEPPSVADVNNMPELTEIHRILLEGGVTIVEGLTNLDQLPDSEFEFTALPLKIHRGDGSPCRAFAKL